MDLAIYVPANGGTITVAEFQLLSEEPPKTYLLDESSPYFLATMQGLFIDKDRVWIGPEMARVLDLDAALPYCMDFQLMDADTVFSLVGTVESPWDESLPPLPAVEKMVDDIRTRVSSILTAGI